MPEGYLGGKLSDEELVKLKEITDFDRSIILAVDGKADFSAIKEYITENKLLSESEAGIAAQRIEDKIKRLSLNFFWWWQFLICIFFFIGGYYFPVINLSFMAKVRKVDMEEEVSQFHTIFDAHAYEPCACGRDSEWMEAFSIYFKEPLQKCLSNFIRSLRSSEERGRRGFSAFIRIIESSVGP